MANKALPWIMGGLGAAAAAGAAVFFLRGSPSTPTVAQTQPASSVVSLGTSVATNPAAILRQQSVQQQHTSNADSWAADIAAIGGAAGGILGALGASSWF